MAHRLYLGHTPDDSARLLEKIWMIALTKQGSAPSNKRFPARIRHFLKRQQLGQLSGQVLVRISAFLIWHIIN
jgi:hypothetical protein